MGGGGKETFAMTDVTPNEARMPEDAAVTVTNADTLRAMASPIRMRILGTLRVNGEQTVGSISEQLGEAPGAISYHLGQLAHAGLVKKVESPDGDRRKSWWKACQSAIRLGNSEEKNGADKAKAMDLFRRSAALSYEMAYERFLDMKRLQRGGKSVKSNRKIHNRYVFGAFASIAERLMYEFTEDVIARIRESELGRTK